MPQPTPSRRAFFKTAGLAAASLTLGRTSASATAPIPDGTHDAVRNSDLIPFHIGVASYSLRELSVDGVIDAMHALQTPWLCLKSFHLPYELSPDEMAAARAKYEAAGLTIVGGGNIALRKDDDDDIRKYFDYAKAAGMPVMVCSPLIAALPRIEKFVKEYDIKIAIHNHGPEDKEYPAASDALRYLEGMDPRMGVCLDIGHATRAGADIVEEAALAGPRLFDVHLKDLKVATERDSQCIMGEGVLPLAPLFRQLQRQGYTGCANLEYEIDAKDPVPGMLRSIAYLRGTLAGLTTA
ncbi:sugar phosphate isomerase/epimerase family protein [Actomonas aquatica]|uniref:Sugar phosphate isomerase/epimerase family protein n=1 Tax=Actomonas aquatica TaxID=2866162 RepID=A0ABZ1C1S5_9BACT|nr:sugar phosphate isomerase/epimerase family protein [Opitutus sp. WL0086]WRQ85571.1 sugar phosphate isomerase/epimerase family protein [Opitutus sp. WL0086]